MDKQKRHEKTPGEHANELRNYGALNFYKEIEELARNEHTQRLAQLTGSKKAFALLLLLAAELDVHKKEIAELNQEVSKLKLYSLGAPDGEQTKNAITIISGDL